MASDMPPIYKVHKGYYFDVGYLYPVEVALRIVGYPVGEGSRLMPVFIVAPNGHIAAYIIVIAHRKLKMFTLRTETREQIIHNVW